jgi:chloramphenicol-sensitive protein RarD
MSAGVWYAVGAYAAWGLFPIYWKLVAHVPAIQLIGHRILWSFLALAGVLAVSRQWRALAAVMSARIVRLYALAAALIGVNWFTYVWAVNAGFIVETSLGYFINPLLSVVLGVVVLGERLRRLQWMAVGLAAAGVFYLTFAYGALPWIALVLACTFGLYGLIKKIAPLGSLQGLTLETGILFVPALAYLIAAERAGDGAFLHTGPAADLLMAGAGLVTTLPLLMFASALRRIPLSVTGVLQFIAPTLQFLLGVLVYKEPFTRVQFVGFSLVWAALVVFGLDGAAARRATA